LPSQIRAILCALAIASPALAATRKAPAGPGGDCLSCHADQYLKKQVVHPPVKNGLCGACHVSQSETEHVFALAADGKQLCRQCHGPRDTQKVLHNPVKEGLCLFCHDPHASDNYVRLRRTIFDTCTTCHPSKDYRMKRRSPSTARSIPSRTIKYASPATTPIRAITRSASRPGRR
jgi:predicted CXXCH cytochrome family protein